MSVRIYGHGMHDFSKEGHDRLYMQAKYAFPDTQLIIGSMSDKTIKDNAKVELLYTELERSESIFHCRHVDEVLCDAPWLIDDAFLDEHNIDYVALTDSDYETLLVEQKDLIDQQDGEAGANYIKNLKASRRFLKLKPKEDIGDLIHKMAPFSDDPISAERRNRCSYNFNNKIRRDQADQAGRPIRIYADGIYDMFHPGHARQLKQVKEAFKSVHVIVGVVNDELTLRYKGPTVVPERYRYERVRHCIYVDEVIRDAPWVIGEKFLIENKIDFVAHDDIPYKCEGQEDVYKSIKNMGMFLTTQRMEGISTTDLKRRMSYDN